MQKEKHRCTPDCKKKNVEGVDTNTDKVLDEVYAERVRQDLKWGVQMHSKDKWLTILMEEVGEAAKANLENINSGKDSYRNEMVQAAAVIVSAIEDFDRQSASNVHDLCETHGGHKEE